MLKQQRILNKDIKCLLFIVFLLTVIGLIFIYSASSVYALESFGSSNYFLKKQLFFLLPAFLGFLFCSKVPLKLVRRATPLIFFASLILMFLVFVPSFGMQINGARRWLNFFFISFQPSEILKFSLFLYLGFFIDRKHTKIHSLFQGYIPFIIILGICSLALFNQPDFGTIITIFLTALILFFIADFSLYHLFITVICLIPVVLSSIFFRSYRLKRIFVFLNPWEDPQGRGYQIIQSLISIGCGGLLGLGIGQSKQKFFYLPMQHTDFIFSIIAEETGFIGSLFIILLYSFFCFFGVRLAFNLEDTFASFTTLGFIVLLSLQAIINLMVVSSLIPTKGFGLPFISYGGTALVINYCMIGLITNFANSQLNKNPIN